MNGSCSASSLRAARSRPLSAACRGLTTDSRAGGFAVAESVADADVPEPRNPRDLAGERRGTLNRSAGRHDPHGRHATLPTVSTVAVANVLPRVQRAREDPHVRNPLARPRALDLEHAGSERSGG